MSKEPTLDDLEQALMDRARRLADEYLARAESTRERMLRDENEHLRVREEREVLAAELEAERLYRSKVQATEMELRSELDRRRWEMVQQLKESISKHLDDITAHADYPDLLQRFLGAAAEALEDEDTEVRATALHALKSITGLTLGLDRLDWSRAVLD